MFDKRLKDLRIYEDLSQKETADIIGTHRNTYRKYETGRWEMPLKKAMLLAKYHNVSLRYLFELSNERENYDIEQYDLIRRMKILRKRKGKTQKQIAVEVLFCLNLTYQRYEKGISEIPIDILIQLAKYFDVTVDYLVGSGSFS